MSDLALVFSHGAVAIAGLAIGLLVGAFARPRKRDDERRHYLDDFDAWGMQ